MLNASWNRWVLRALRKDELASTVRTDVGRLFHTSGPQTEKAHLPNWVRVPCIAAALVVVEGSCRWVLVEWLRDWEMSFHAEHWIAREIGECRLCIVIQCSLPLWKTLRLCTVYSRVICSTSVNDDYVYLSVDEWNFKRIDTDVAGFQQHCTLRRSRWKQGLKCVFPCRTLSSPVCSGVSLRNCSLTCRKTSHCKIPVVAASIMQHCLVWHCNVYWTCNTFNSIVQ